MLNNDSRFPPRRRKTEQLNSEFPTGFKTLLRHLAADADVSMGIFVVNAVMALPQAKAYVATHTCEFEWPIDNSEAA